MISQAKSYSIVHPHFDFHCTVVFVENVHMCTDIPALLFFSEGPHGIRWHFLNT